MSHVARLDAHHTDGRAADAGNFRHAWPSAGHQKTYNDS
jgi:hypothetical protein